LYENDALNCFHILLFVSNEMHVSTGIPTFLRMLQNTGKQHSRLIQLLTKHVGTVIEKVWHGCMREIFLMISVFSISLVQYFCAE